MIAVPVLVAGLFWAGSDAYASSESSNNLIQDSFRQFSTILATVEEHYADELDTEDVIYHGVIPYMLRTLDPHSSFMDPDAFKQLRDNQQGHYAGVGMSIGTQNNSTVVVAPFPRTPAYRAGLRPGDVIVEVDQENVEGLTVTEVAQRLRGQVSTKVMIGVQRRGVEKLIEKIVTRERIPRPSIPISFRIKPDIGFVRIDTFNENTGNELDKALTNLKSKDLKGLVLDLRGNRGGLLSEGVRVSDRFLEKGQTIVSHHGRSSRERNYNVRNGNRGNQFPLVVIVNCESASASEIVAGALQDHDRALIVGHSTFGKGLVQTVYTLSESSGLALTTARYYTPSGRLIQRQYDGVSMIDYYNNPCSEGYKPIKEDVRITDKGRRVFAGGGITPDIEFKKKKSNEFQWLLNRNFAINTFAQDYSRENIDLPSGWDVTDAVIEEFKQFLDAERIQFEEGDFQANLDHMKRLIKRAVYNSAFDIEEGQRVYFELDPDVQQAIESLPLAQRLLEDTERLVAAGGNHE